MSSTHAITAPSRSPWWTNIFYGGFIIAIADAIFFSIYWNQRGVAPGRILQSIASGVLGKASFDGGTATMLLGAVLHLFIAIMFVLVYALVARRVTALLRQPFLYGPPYGLLVWFLMTYAVLPLSLVKQGGSLPMSWTIGSIVFHTVVVGLTSAWFARRAYARIA